MSIGPSKLSAVSIDESNLPCLGHLKKLLDCKTLRVVPPQYIIFSQGESPHSVCLICKGMVKLTRTESNGTRAIIGLRRKGWLLGAAAVVPGLSYASTAETMVRSELCFIPVERFLHAMDTNATFTKWVATILGQGLYKSTVDISKQSCLTGRMRLEKFLLDIFQEQSKLDLKNASILRIPLKQWEIAQLLGLSPEHLSRLIKQMEAEDVVARKNDWLIYQPPKKKAYLK